MQFATDLIDNQHEYEAQYEREADRRMWIAAMLVFFGFVLVVIAMDCMIVGVYLVPIRIDQFVLYFGIFGQADEFLLIGTLL